MNSSDIHASTTPATTPDTKTDIPIVVQPSTQAPVDNPVVAATTNGKFNCSSCACVDTNCTCDTCILATITPTPTPTTPEVTPAPTNTTTPTTATPTTPEATPTPAPAPAPTTPTVEHFRDSTKHVLTIALLLLLLAYLFKNRKSLM